MCSAADYLAIIIGNVGVSIFIFAMIFGLIDKSWTNWAIKHNLARYNSKTGKLEIDE